MGKAKDIILRPIDRRTADAVVKAHHYSGKVVNNSQLHIGVFYRGSLEGAMQFGPSLDKRKVQALVEDTPWNGFLELNRMAFSDVLPRNSESRAISIAMRLLRRHAPHVQWVISFSDGAQCGHGTIYQASGFVLTGIKKNTQVWVAPSGESFSRTSLTDGRSKKEQRRARVVASRTSLTKGGNNHHTGGASMKAYKAAGWRPLPGFQLRYLYFIDRTARQRLTVPVLPFSAIDDRGARMYRGQRVGSDTSDTAGYQPEEDGATPISTLTQDNL
jgi:hypothetical protein